jgi:hypothetical protein
MSAKVGGNNIIAKGIPKYPVFPVPALNAKIFPVGLSQDFPQIKSEEKAKTEQKTYKNIGKIATEKSIFTVMTAEKTTIGPKI